MWGDRGRCGAEERLADWAGPVSAGSSRNHFEELFNADAPEEAQLRAETLLEAAERLRDERMKVLGLCKSVDALVAQQSVTQELAAEAMAKVREAQQLCEELGDFEEGEAAVSYASARCHLRYGGADEEMQDKALEDGAEAAALCRLVGSKKGEAFSLLTVGDAYHQGKEADKALEYHRSAAGVFKEIGDSGGSALAYRKVAEDFLKLKRDVKKATANAKRAISIFQEIQDPPAEANGWHLLAEIYVAEGDLANASECVTNARSLCKSLKDHVAETKAMETLVAAFLENDQFPEGIQVAKEIVSVHHKANDKEREGFALVSLAQHLLRLSDFRNAEKVSGAAEFIFRSIHEKEGVKMTQSLKEAAEHGLKAEHIQQAVAQRQEFLNLPQPLIIDPGRKTRMQEAFNEFAKSA
ncbi:unnamed protein product [Durusdinium trenchii]|uniref:Tetratricopeptide repeat protein 28 n=2 Tax=Durusdinium trenchii TaxID=1381693 RepID=A0ABP0HBD7_9DINO